jgi:hypothetical protein
MSRVQFNDAMGHLLLSFILVPYHGWRLSHKKHPSVFWLGPLGLPYAVGFAECESVLLVF